MRRRPVVYHSRLDPDPATTGIALLLACGLSMVVTLLLFPPWTPEQTFEQAVVRFGYEGPEQYVREIHVRLTRHSVTSSSANRLMGAVRRVPDAPRGETGTPVRSGGRRGRGQGGLSTIPGSATQSSLGDLIGRRLDLPTIQSEELVIRTLVKPDYPTAAIEQGIEGRVRLLALVDVRGLVEDVVVVRSAGQLLDGAAMNAVRRCRFEPYRRGGRIQPVYAEFRFNFTLLDR